MTLEQTISAIRPLDEKSMTAARNDLPVLVIRALSDNADTDYVEFKEFDIAEYADTAAKIAVNIVKRM